MAVSDATAVLVYVGSGTYDLVLIDLATGTVTRLDGTLGRPSDKTIAIIDGKLYIGSGDPGYLLESDGETSRVIGQCGDRDYYTSAVDGKGRLWLGTYPKGTLEIYDPATDTLSQIGEFDSAFTDPQYVYTLATDGRYAYAGMGQAPWYLAIIDSETGEAAQHFKGGSGTRHVAVAADDSGIYYGGNSEWYKLENGEPTPVESVPPLHPWYRPNNVVIDKGAFSATGYELDLGEATAATGFTPVVRWRQGEGEWQEASIEGLTLGSATIKRLVNTPNGLLAVTGFYGPVAWYDPEGKTFDVIGWPQRSLYDALANGDDIYLSGYTAVTFRWDTTQPWTLTASTTNLSVSNPRQVAGWHKYHYFQAFDANGLLWVGINHERDSTGGELGWYDPATEAKGSLRDDFERWTPRGLAAVGDEIVYSGNSRDGDDGKLFVVDTVTKAVARSYAPVSGSTDAGVITAVSETDVVGIVGTTAYRINITTGAVAWSVTLPGTAFGAMRWYDRRVAVDSDGWLWFAVGSAIYKLNPANGTATKVLDAGGAYNVCFHQGKAYLYGGTVIKHVIA